jgi:hypothetical protein
MTGMTTDTTLAAIDTALDGWEHHHDATRWQADGGPDRLRPSPAEEFARMMEGMAATGNAYIAAVTPAIQSFSEALGEAGGAYAEFLALAFHTHATAPRDRIRCRRCNPAGNPGPWAGGYKPGPKAARMTRQKHNRRRR